MKTMFEKPTRNHASFIVERLGIVFFALLFFGWNSLGDSVRRLLNPSFWRGITAQTFLLYGRSFLLGGGLVLLLILAVLIFSVFVWRKTFFYLQDDCLVYEQRTLFHHSAKLPLQNIATVNLERSLLERLLGTAKVKVDANSASTANKTNFTFILHQVTAQQLHDSLLARRAALLQGEGEENPSAAPEPMAASPRVEVISFSAPRVLLHRLLSIPFLQGIVVLIVFGSSFIGPGGYGLPLAEVLPSLLFFVFCGVIAAIYSTLNLMNYRVARDATHIYISCGLLKKVSYSFHEQRIQGVFVKQPLLARLFGFYSIEVAVVGLGNEKKETPQLCLLTTKAQMERVLALCAPQYTECTGQKIRPSKAALLPLALRTLFLSLLSLLFLFAPIPNAWILPAAATLLCVLGGILSHRTKALQFDGRVLHYTRGVFTRFTGMFRYGNLQDADIRGNRLMTRLGAARLTVTLLSGMKQKVHQTGWFSGELLDELGGKVVANEDASVEWMYS